LLVLVPALVRVLAHDQGPVPSPVPLLASCRISWIFRRAVQPGRVRFRPHVQVTCPAQSRAVPPEVLPLNSCVDRLNRELCQRAASDLVPVLASDQA
jgi:hypothetical protein